MERKKRKKRKGQLANGEYVRTRITKARATTSMQNSIKSLLGRILGNQHLKGSL